MPLTVKITRELAADTFVAGGKLTSSKGKSVLIDVEVLVKKNPETEEYTLHIQDSLLPTIINGKRIKAYENALPAKIVKGKLKFSNFYLKTYQPLKFE
jgi:hypothetical protein